MRKLILITILLILLPSVMGATLKDYPYFFIEDDKMDVSIVVGDLAVASDTIGAVNLATSLQHNENINITYEAGIEPKLASEVDNIKEENIIAVGGPCANSVAAELMGYPEVCNEEVPPNKGMIKLYEHENSYSLLVAGWSSLDTRRTTNVLADYENYNMPDSDQLTVARTETQVITVR